MAGERSLEAKVPPPLLLVREWLAAGAANATASMVLNPVDVTKTRLQAFLVDSTHAQPPRIVDIVRTIYQDAGLLGLWLPGLTASMAREMLYSGVRAGFYVPVRNSLQSALGDEHDDQSIVPKLLAALATGTLGSVIANPLDVVKIRMMVAPNQYSSVFAGVSCIFHGEGVLGLYKGVLPSTLRGAMIAMGELATYDQAKYLLKKYSSVHEGGVLHIVSSLITGLVATTVAAPFDLLKTRAMNAAVSDAGVLALASSAVRAEGVGVLFRGWLPAYCRLGPHAIICFPIFEQFRRLMGLEYL